MLHRTIRSLTTLCLVLTPVVIAGCDRDDEVDEPRSAAQDDDDDEADGDEQARGRHHKSPADKLCDAVSCSDAQREKITGLLAANKPERPSDETFASANAALAAAWKDADFDADDLAAWRDTVHDEGGPRLSAQTIVDVHAVLDAKQRGMVADMFEARGPGMFFGHRGGKHGKRDHGRDEAASADEAGKGPRGKKGPDHAGGSLCDRVSCTDEQRTQITAALEGGRPERTRDEAADRALATSFRSDGLAVADVERYLGTLKQEHAKESAARDAVMVTIHHTLTAEQRATLATDITAHGPRGLIKGGRHHGGRGKKHGRDKSAGGEQPA